MSRIWMLGDNVNTDVIIPGRYNVTTDRAQLARYCLCEVLAAFSQQVEAGDVVMAGHNFGCGSSREHAPAALLACGVQVVRDRRFEMSRPRKQQRSHQTTSTHKKASARSRAIRLEIASEQLIEKGNIQEAVRVLREQVQTAPSDEKRRLRGECLFDLKHYQEAAAAWLTLQEKTAGDLQSVGVAFLNAKDWEQARQFLDESVQRVENAYTYYLLALTHLRGELWYSVDIETNQKVLNLLQRARALPGCPPRGYLLLDHVLWSLACKKTEAEDEEVQDQARAQAREQCGEVLEEAFRLYADHDQIRLEFAKSLVLRKQYEAALIVLVIGLSDREKQLL